MFNNTVSSILKLQSNIDRIITFLEPRDFINCHMVSYICDDLWKKFIPEGIRNEVKTTEDVESAIKLFFHQNDYSSPELIAKHQHLYKHIQHTKSFYLENLSDKLYITADELQDEFKKMNIEHSGGINSLSIREFMKEKKNHEVEVISGIIAKLSKSHGKDHLIIDLGDGKGYLSSRLSLEYKLKVIGVDGNDSNTKEAVKRNEKLSKKWKTLVIKEATKQNISADGLVDNEALQNNLYKTTSKMIFANTNLKNLVDDAFPEEETSDICLVGLHTCGNLASNSLKQFVRTDNIKILCNVGCCYHLIFEEFEDDFFNDEMRMMDEQDSPGFPMSRYLRDKKYKLGRNARMLAAQCFERVLAEKKMPDDSLFYRALFEKILREKWLNPNQSLKVLKLGRLKFKSFEDYLRKGCKKFDIDMNLSSDEISDYLKEHEMDRRLINLNYFIRMHMAKIIETLILLDRSLYLLENNADKVLLVKVFDPVVSPRNYSIIAFKK